MSVIRLQEKTPDVYCEQSRDFQLLCRLYDCIINGTKFDIDTMKNITDTKLCRTNMLQLLQTKVGYFSSLNMTDEALRYILQAFPTLIKNKGSLKAIEQAVNVFLKIYDIQTQVAVWYVSEATTMYNVQVDDHTIVVALDTAMKDVKILDELFRYILPVGFGFYFYFFNSLEQAEQYMSEEKAVLLLVSDSVNSQIRSTTPSYSDDTENRLIGAVDTIETITSVDGSGLLNPDPTHIDIEDE